MVTALLMVFLAGGPEDAALPTGEPPPAAALSDPASARGPGASAGGPDEPSETPIPPHILRRLLAMERRDAPAPDSTNRVADDPLAARLGQRIFFEPRLSANGQVSCSTCHDPRRAFTDGHRRAMGLREGERNTQGLLDIADLPWFTWDGRADSLWSQALHPFESDAEMGLPRRDLIERIRLIEPLRRDYEEVFGALPPPQADAQAVDRAFSNIGKAIAAYERRLRTGPGPFDRHLARLRRGEPRDRHDFSDEAHRGMLLFAGRANCWRCHHGPSLSDGSFHSIGVPPLHGGLPRDRGRLDAIGRLKASPFNAAGPFSDDPSGTRAQLTMSQTEEPALWGAMRTPPLRNVAQTSPYMHEGQFESLEEVVRFYSTLEGALADHHGERVLEPLGLSDEEVKELVAFLRALDGSPLPAELLGPPADGSLPRDSRASEP